MLAKRIKILRMGSEISQSTLANVLGVSQQAVAKWEAGKAEPDSSTLTRLANYFNVSVDYLLGNETRSVSLSSDEIKLLRLYRALDQITRALVMTILEKFNGISNGSQHIENGGAVGNNGLNGNINVLTV